VIVPGTGQKELVLRWPSKPGVACPFTQRGIGVRTALEESTMKRLAKLLEAGQSCWMDHLTRETIRQGALQRRIEQGIRGITTNPKIFRDAIVGSAAYDEQIRERGRATPQECFEALAIADVQEACDALREVYHQSDGTDGYVSLEVSPHLAHDTEGSLRAARRLFSAVERPNVFIKIPGSPAGIPAIEQLLYEGININITLLFSIDRYQEVARAYLRALERRAAGGSSLAAVASVASFFLSRIDVLVDQLLEHRRDVHPAGKPSVESLRGQAAIANAKLAYQAFQRVFSGPKWDELVRRGARPQRLLWASTSTKDPAYRDVRYVEPLIGPATVNTMPEGTIDAFIDHGVIAPTLSEGLDEARQVLDSLAAIGIELRCVTWQLLNEGVQKFIDPYDALLATLADKQREQGLQSAS
jgi:transaldolase